MTRIPHLCTKANDRIWRRSRLQFPCMSKTPSAAASKHVWRRAPVWEVRHPSHPAHYASPHQRRQGLHKLDSEPPDVTCDVPRSSLTMKTVHLTLHANAPSTFLPTWSGSP
jgi:hypothetical protein